MPEIKFCPYCGHTTLFETKTVRCHGCGEDFIVLQKDSASALANFKETVQEFIDGHITLSELENAL